MARVPCWLGIAADHLYEHCPVRLRELPNLRRYQWDGQGSGKVNPLALDICRWCKRAWSAGASAPAAPAPLAPAVTPPVVVARPVKPKTKRKWNPRRRCEVARWPGSATLCGRPRGHRGDHVGSGPAGTPYTWPRVGA